MFKLIIIIASISQGSSVTIPVNSFSFATDCIKAGAIAINHVVKGIPETEDRKVDFACEYQDNYNKI